MLDALIAALRRWYSSTKALQEKITDLRVEVRELKLANGRLSERIKGLQRENTSLAEQLETLTQDTDSAFPSDIKFEPWGFIDQDTVDWVKDAIEQTDMCGVLEQGQVGEIRVVDDPCVHVPNLVAGALASIVRYTDGPWTIVVKDRDWMPGWDLPGAILHEAIHCWQGLYGLTKRPENEVQAYTVQQVFEWRYCELNDKEPRNLFKVKDGAIGLL